MVTSVQNSSTTDVSAFNKQIQDFKDGKAKITRNDLGSIVAQQVKQGQSPSAAVVNLIGSYDKIDKNGDGISYDEFQSYSSTPAALLANLGITPNSLNSQLNLLNAGILGNTSSDNSMMSTLLGSSTTSTSSSANNNSLSSLLAQNGTSSYSSLINSSKSLSLLDFIS